MKVSVPIKAPGGASPTGRPERIPQERNKLLVFGLLALAALAFPYVIQPFLQGTAYVDWVSTASGGLCGSC